MGTISAVGKSFEAEPAYREEGEPPIKKRKTEQRKTLTSLSADLQAHVESYLDPASAANVARCCKLLYQAHVDRILLVNPEVAGRLAILDVDKIPQIWKDKLASIKSIILPELRDHFGPFQQYSIHDDVVRYIRNIVKNTSQVMQIDLTKFQRKDIEFTTKSALMAALLWRDLPKLKSIHGLSLCTDTDFYLLDYAKHGEVLAGLLKLDLFEEGTFGEKISADAIQKVAKSFPKLTQLNIRLLGKPSKEMIAALDHWLTKENLPAIKAVDIEVTLNKSLKVPIPLNLHEMSFARAIKVIDSL